jgi:predicted nucleotidyltransferase component of viral defense system
LELLKEIQAHDIFQEFYLVGGTALALQLGHRKSIDLDLFTTNDFDLNHVLETLEQNFNFRSDFTARNTVKGSIEDVKIDFISHKYPLIRKSIVEGGIRLLSMEDIAAMKLNAIAGNGTRSKDFIDIYFLLKQYSVNDIIHFYKEKYNQRNIFHILKSLVYFDDINTVDWPEMIIENTLTLNNVIDFIEMKVTEFEH